MPTIRPPRVFGAATAGFALTFGILAAADPAWAGVVGVDVWNVGELEMELKRSEVRKTGLDHQMEVMDQAFTLNRLLTEELAAGERPLAEAADLFAAANREVAGTETMLEFEYPGGTPRGRIARYLIDRAERSAGAKPAAVARLRAEYASAFPGEPAL